MDSNQNAQEPSRQENQQKQQAVDAPISFVPSVLHQLGLDREEPRMSVSINEQLAAFNDSDWRMRVSAIRTLESWGTRVPLAVLVKALEDEDSSVRAAAVHALGLLGEQAPVERLLSVLHDSDWHVRETAVLALGGLGAHVPEKSLVLALKDSDSMVREAAQLVLHKRHNVVISTIAPEEASHSYEPQTSYSIIMDDSYPLEAYADKYGQFSRMDTLQRLEPRKVGFLHAHWGVLTVCAVLLIIAANVSGWLLFTLSWHGSVSSSVFMQAIPTVMPGVPMAAPTPLPPPITSVLGTPVANIPVGQTIYTYHGQSAYISGVAWSPTGTLIASASADGTLKVWDAFTGQQVFKWSEPYHNALLAVAWSPDGNYIAVGGTDADSAGVYILDADNGRIVSIYPIGSIVPQASEAHIGALKAISGGGPGTVYSLAWSPDNQYVAAAVGDGTVRVFNAKTGTVVGLPGIQGGGNVVAGSVTWSPDGSYIAYGLGTQLVLWNITTRQLQTYMPNIPGDWVTSVTWSSDNQNIAIGVAQMNAGNVAVDIWDPFTGKDSIYKNRFAGTWSPDGIYIAGADTSHDVQIWGAVNGNVLFTYADKAGPVSSVAWSPDGSFIASGDDRGGVNVWRAP